MVILLSFLDDKICKVGNFAFHFCIKNSFLSGGNASSLETQDYGTEQTLQNFFALCLPCDELATSPSCALPCQPHSDNELYKLIRK